MKQEMALINEYSHPGNLSPECFHFRRLRTCSLIGLGELSEEVVKLQGFLFVPGHQITGQGSDPRGDAPMSLFKLQLSDESIQKTYFPRNSQVLSQYHDRRQEATQLGIMKRF